MFKKIRQYIKRKKYPFYMGENRKYRTYDIGAYTYGRPTVFGDAHLSVGKFCSISMTSTISLGGEHHSDWVSTYPFNAAFPSVQKQTTFSKGDVVIGNDVWIADGAMILSGVTIGDGAIIGARAVVAKDVKPYEIVGGNPARHIRYRFSQEQIAKLLAIQWWAWPVEKIAANFDLIMDSDIDAFINKHYEGA